MSTAIEKPTDMVGYLKTMGPAIATALPKHISADRIARVAMTALRSKPKLQECTPLSFYGALLTAAQLGLEVNTPLGHAYLIPYGRECTFQLGYQGMLDLARRSGLVKSIRAHEVYERDLFDYEYGLNPMLKHKPAEGERGQVTHVYAVAKLLDDEPLFTVLTVAEVESYRARSRAAKDGPWVTDWIAMAKKTAVRRLYTWLPKSVEMANAHAADDSPEPAEAYPEVGNALAFLPAEPAPPAQPDPVPEGTPEGQRVPAGSR